MDPPLTGRGREQAVKAAGRLAGSGIEVVYTSPLSRARETAEIIAGSLGCDLVVEEEFSEIDVGEAEGLTLSEVERKFGPELSMLLEKKEDAGFPGGETIGMFRRRASSAWRKLAEGRDSDVVACVSHGWMINALLREAGVLDRGSPNLVLPNGSIQHLRRTDGGWEAVALERSEEERPEDRVWRIF